MPRRAPHVRKGCGIFFAFASSIAFLLLCDVHNSFWDTVSHLHASNCFGSPATERLFDWVPFRRMSSRNATSAQSIAEDLVLESATITEETLTVCGTDRRGRPLLIARPFLHVATTEEESLQAVEKCLGTVRESLRGLPVAQHNALFVLYDLSGASYKNFDMTFSRGLLDGLNREFADRLGQVLVVNGHWSVRAAWHAIRVLLHPETRRKVVFVGADLDQLEELIDADHPYMKRLRLSQRTAMYQ